MSEQIALLQKQQPECVVALVTFSNTVSVVITLILTTSLSFASTLTLTRFHDR